MAAILWLPSLHLFFTPRLSIVISESGLSRTARALTAQHLALWADPKMRARQIDRMRASNAEWDFMARTFFVLSLANIGLRDPSLRPRCLAVMDAIIDETLRLERENGIYHFLMPYARYGEFVSKKRRSLFQDGEIGLMMAARRLVEEKPEYRPLFAERVNVMSAQMQESPVLSGESYPDECWMFCNSVALAAVRAADHLDGTDHSEFFRRWLATAKKRLVHPPTGLLVSSYTLAGDVGDGPEGSTIWLAAHCLRLVDEAFARDQYERARKELAGRLCGFGYAREWPASWHGSTDVDSGPIIPVLAISAGSSGLALVGARSFDDGDFLRALWTSLDFAGFPIRRGDALKYGASNQVGDSVMLYALVLGPAWDRILAGKAPEGGGRRR